MSPRVMSSGKDPPVFSNRDLRKAPSSGQELVPRIVKKSIEIKVESVVLERVSYLFQSARQHPEDTRPAQPRTLSLQVPLNH